MLPPNCPVHALVPGRVRIVMRRAADAVSRKWIVVDDDFWI
jgi:hypothetical protein